MAGLLKYVRENLLAGLKASPLRNIRYSLGILVVYALAACVAGDTGGVFKHEVLKSNLVFILPFTMFVFPCLLEEAFFRGILIPRSVFDKGLREKGTAVFLSTLLFVLWHPANAFLLNTGARGFFYDPVFLLIVFLLGIACGAVYIASRSLWAPVMIHWLTVLVWVFFLGGRNLVKEVSP
ncbi:MAG: CPBP family intramembrane metalloprotease [Planctomycetes bacterium]|nr:CPBP family intramembrane metalloprotease [Planctomycetota bacterium]